MKNILEKEKKEEKIEEFKESIEKKHIPNTILDRDFSDIEKNKTDDIEILQNNSQTENNETLESNQNNSGLKKEVLENSKYELNSTTKSEALTKILEAEKDYNAELVADEVFKNKKYVKFKLSEFEGPLDLLYSLIKENKVEIEDIFISDITRQYLEIVTNADFSDVEYAGEFLVMAATLLEIKSKRLLPVVKTEEENEVDPDYDEKMLIRQVKEYKLFKEASEKLLENEALYQFTKDPKFSEDDFRVTITNFNLDKLVNAFAQIINRAEIKQEITKPRKIIKERFTVANRVKFISKKVIDAKEINFTDLYEEDFSRLEIINTFLAILELLKRQYIEAVQNEKFGDIHLKVRDGINEVIDEETVEDEY